MTCFLFTFAHITRQLFQLSACTFYGFHLIPSIMTQHNQHIPSTKTPSGTATSELIQYQNVYYHEDMIYSQPTLLPSMILICANTPIHSMVNNIHWIGWARHSLLAFSNGIWICVASVCCCSYYYYYFSFWLILRSTHHVLSCFVKLCNDRNEINCYYHRLFATDLLSTWLNWQRMGFWVDAHVHTLMVQYVKCLQILVKYSGLFTVHLFLWM